MMAMVPEVKALLLDALKSGSYEKTRGCLSRMDDNGVVGYCCLGVLTDIASNRGVCPAFTEGFDFEDSKIYAIREDSHDDWPTRYSTSYLPDSVKEWSGLDQIDEGKLAVLNDSNETFSEVIEYIETNF